MRTPPREKVVKFECKFSELHYSAWNSRMRESRYQIVRKRELVPISVAASLIGWSEEQVMKSPRFQIIEFKDGLWVYPKELFQVFSERGKYQG